MRTEKDIIERLTELGMPGAALLEPAEPIMVAPHPAGEGRAARAPEDPSSAIARGTFVPVASAALEAGGVLLAMLDEWPEVLRFTCFQGSAIVDLRGFPWVAFDTEDPGIACCLASDPKGSLVITTGEAYFVDWPGRVIERVSWPLVLNAPPDLSVGVALEWARDSADDWLHDEIHSRLDGGGTWEIAVTAGMFARLQRLTPARAREIASAQLRGEVDEAAARPWRWVRRLSAMELTALEGLSLAEIDILHRSLADLRRTLAAEDPIWRDDVRELCHRRDDVECVWRLLNEAGAGRRVRMLLASLDIAADALVAGLRGECQLDDERLRRVGAEQPDAWWGRMASRARA